MQHSNVSYPVIGVLYIDGYPVNFRFKGGGTLEEAAVALVRSMLPQNDIAKQEVNHVGSTTVVGIDSGESAILGSVPCGKAGR